MDPSAKSGGEAPAPVQSFAYVPALDGLRGVAISLVVLSHLENVEPGDLIRKRGYVPGGFLGVDLFFVLSGFLITALLLREVGDHAKVRLGAFYIRRALRLLPALYLFLVAHVVYAVAAGLPGHAEWTSLWTASLYVTNWQAVDNIFSINEGLGHLWSLAVEEQFYLVWPLVLLLGLGLDRTTRALRAFLVLTIVVVGVHRAIAWQGGVYWLKLYIRTDTRIDTLLVGALLAVIWAPGSCRRWARIVPAGWCAVVVLVLMVSFGRPKEGFVYHGGFTLFAVAAAVLVLAVVETDRGPARVLALAPVRGLGRVSYGLYLWHPLVFLAVHRWAPDGMATATRIGVALLLTTTATAFSYHFVERPALRLKDRVRAGPATKAVASA